MTGPFEVTNFCSGKKAIKSNSQSWLVVTYPLSNFYPLVTGRHARGGEGGGEGDRGVKVVGWEVISSGSGGPLSSTVW